MEVDLPKVVFLRKSAIFRSSKLPFDAEDAEKFWNGIYYAANIYKIGHKSIFKNWILLKNLTLDKIYERWHF